MIAEELKVVVRAEVDRALHDMGRLEKKVGNTESKFRRFSDRVGKVGRTLSATLTPAIIGAGIASVKFAADIEKQQQALATMLKDANKASELYQEWQRFSASTPFQLEEISQAGKMLIAFGETADDVTETLQRIGDVSAGVGAPLGEIAEIYGKARVQQTLFAEDLNQLAGRGIPIFTELAEVMGVNASEVKKLGSQGQISFSMLEEVFKNLTEQGGQFQGLMEDLSQTTAGKFSTAMDNLKLAAAELGKELLPTINQIIDGITDLVKKFRGLDEGRKKFVLMVSAITAVTPLLLTAFSAIAAHPLIAAILAGTLAVTGIVKLMDLVESDAKQFEALLGSYKQLGATQVDFSKRIKEAALKFDIPLRQAIKLAEEHDIIVDNLKEEVAQYSQMEIEDRKRLARQEQIYQAKEDELATQEDINDALKEASEETLSQGQRDFVEIHAGLKKEMDMIDQMSKVYKEVGKEYDVQKEKHEALMGAIQELADRGYKFERKNIQTLIELYPEYYKQVEKAKEETQEFIKTGNTLAIMLTDAIIENIGEASLKIEEPIRNVLEVATGMTTDAITQMFESRKTEQAIEKGATTFTRQLIDAINMNITKNAPEIDIQPFILETAAGLRDSFLADLIQGNLRQDELGDYRGTTGSNLGDTREELEHTQKALENYTEATRKLQKELQKLKEKQEDLNSQIDSFKDSIESILKQSYLNMFESLGEALATGADAGQAFRRSFNDMIKQITDQTAQLMLNAGLTLISHGQIEAGIALVAGSGLVALFSGLTGGASSADIATYESYIANAEQDLMDQRLEILREQMEKERELMDEKLQMIEEHYSDELYLLRHLLRENVISQGEYTSRLEALQADRFTAEAAASEGYEEAQAAYDSAQQIENDLEDARTQKLATLSAQLLEVQNALDALPFFAPYGMKVPYMAQIAQLESRINAVEGASTIEEVLAAKKGANFVSRNTGMLMYHPNEHVRVNPAPNGGGETIINFNGDVYGDADEIAKKVSEAVDRAKGRRRA